MKLLICLCVWFVAFLVQAQDTTPVFRVAEGLFDDSESDDLGLREPEQMKTVTVYAAAANTDKYVNGAVVVAFKGAFYCMWQSSEKDEDAQDTWVACSRSDDALSWSDPVVLAASPQDGYCTSGGWWVNGDTLVAYINLWSYEESPRYSKVVYKTTTDGLTWEPARPVTMHDGMDMTGAFEQDPHALASGRIVGALHQSPGLHVSPVYTDDPSGLSGWHRGGMSNLPYEGDVTREIEPGWFQRRDGSVVMVFRDQKSSFRKLASVSRDSGRTWTTPRITGMPDSRSKQSAGNLPDGSAFMVGNPVRGKARWPLVLMLSRDTELFNSAYVLRTGRSLPDLKYEGRYKRQGYHYPKSMVYKNCLYVAYTTNKELVELTIVPLDRLP